MSDDGRIFHGIPTPVDMYAKAFAGTLDHPGASGDDMLLGYISCLYDQGLVDGQEMAALTMAAANGSFARGVSDLSDGRCPKCGRPWDVPGAEEPVGEDEEGAR